MSDRFLSPSEVSRRLGVSPKALRLYEQRGLIQPLRSAADWRTYGPEQLVRLHQILALKRLGLSLRRIADVLGRQTSLDGLLALQERTLEAELGRLGRALTLVRAARAKLAAGDPLSIDDLTTLTSETTMAAKATPKELETIFKPLIDKHFSESERQEIATRQPLPLDAHEKWRVLLEEADRLVKIGDPGSPEALDLALRWKAMIDAFTGGDPAIAGKVRSVWMDAFSDPAAAPKLPASPQTFAFIHEALARANQLKTS